MGTCPGSLVCGHLVACGAPVCCGVSVRGCAWPGPGDPGLLAWGWFAPSCPAPCLCSLSRSKALQSSHQALVSSPAAPWGHGALTCASRFLVFLPESSPSPAWPGQPALCHTGRLFKVIKTSLMAAQRRDVCVGGGLAGCDFLACNVLGKTLRRFFFFSLSLFLNDREEKIAASGILSSRCAVQGAGRGPGTRLLCCTVPRL